MDPVHGALVGVSGGRDSVALLHALVEAGSSGLVICHLDHGLRAESAEEGNFVRNLAERLHFDCASGMATIARKTGIEAACREARYAFFARVARERGLSKLLLAHHADDQVETALFNLCRGAGAAGFAAMRPVTERTIAGVRLEILRPFLAVWRTEIDAFLAARSLEFREDPSNADPRHTRNRVRHEALPFLSALFGRDVRRAIWKAAEVCASEHAFLERLLIDDDGAAQLSVAGVRILPVPVQRRVIQAWLRTQGAHDVDYAVVEEVRSLLDMKRAKVNLPRDRFVRRRSGRLFLFPIDPQGTLP